LARGYKNDSYIFHDQTKLPTLKSMKKKDVIERLIG